MAGARPSNERHGRENVSENRVLRKSVEADDTRVGGAILGGGTALLVVIGGLVAVDVVGDWRAGTGFVHLAIELLVIALAVAGLVALWGLYLKGRRREQVLAEDLERAQGEAERWRAEAREHVEGLSHAIDQQFERWGLTVAEREIALLILKGLSMSEIGEIRGTTERTVRQQALAIYKKGGLAGRADLSAFFLEDLLDRRPNA